MATHDRPLDLICLGRVAVTLHGSQLGGPLEDMQSFQMHLGGSSGNVAFGAARLGLRSSLFSRVGDEPLGRFLRAELERVGCDTSHLHTDTERPTALSLHGVRGDGSFPSVLYRERPADLSLSPEDFDETYIALSQALTIAGTHLSHEQTRLTCYEALKAAKAHQTTAILDVGYHPELWGLMPQGEGEDRSVPSPEATRRLEQALPWFDVIVGSEEELRVAGGSGDTLEALRRVRESSDALLVLRRGIEGCVIFEAGAPIPASLEGGLVCPPFPVPAKNPLGGSEAFLSGFLRAYLRGETLATCGLWANACAALVVSRHGGAQAMPSFAELSAFLRKAESLAGKEPDRDGEIRRLHRVAERRERWADVAILAFDHRAEMEERTDDPAVLTRAKGLIAEGARYGAHAAGLPHPHVIVDDRYGASVLSRLSGSGSFLARPIEIPGSRPVAFEGGLDVGLTLARWPREHVVKCLVRYATFDDESLCAAQEARVKALYEACCATGRELMLELITEGDDVFDAPAAMRRFYRLGVFPDWWKLPPPPGDVGWATLGTVIEEHDRHCRGVLMLGLDQEPDELERVLAHAAATTRVCRGFAIGPTIWRRPFETWLEEGDDQAFVRDVAAAYSRFIDVWRQARLVLVQGGGGA